MRSRFHSGDRCLPPLSGAATAAAALATVTAALEAAAALTAAVAPSSPARPARSEAQRGSSSAARSTRLAVRLTAPWISSSVGASETDGSVSSSSTSNSGRVCASRPPAGRRVMRAFMAPRLARMAPRTAMYISRL